MTWKARWATGTASGASSSAADRPIRVASLLESPTGHLTNLSTSPDTKENDGDETLHRVPLFPSAADEHGRQGFVRVVNRGSAGSVRIKAHDTSDRDYDLVTLSFGADETVHFNSDDLELGNAAKGLPEGVGAGAGDWWLELASESDLGVLAYVRHTDGFLTSMHDTVPATDGVHRLPILNPGSNRNQVGRLRLVNVGEEDVEVTIGGFDDAGSASHEQVRLSVAGRSARTVSAGELEEGEAGLTGALGDGVGKWRLEVRTDGSVLVMSLLESPSGQLTNLSTTPSRSAPGD